MEPASKNSRARKTPLPSGKKGVPDPVPWGELFAHAFRVLSAVTVPAFAIWQTRASEGQRILLPFAVAVLIVCGTCVLLAFCQPERRFWRYAACSDLAAALWLFLALIPPERVDAGEVVSVKFEQRTLELERGEGGNGSVRLALASVPSELWLDVTSRHAGTLWTQRVRAESCVGEPDNVVCRLPRLTYRSELFVALDRPQKVRIYAPSNGCEYLAGMSFAAGARMFTANAGPELSVEVQEDDSDFSVAADDIACVGPYDSHLTARLLRECKGFECGLIVSLSSASELSLLAGAHEPPRILRVTTDNRARADDLAWLLEREFAADARSRTLYVLYDDEGAGNATSEVFYAADQARELQHAFAGGLLARYPELNLHWIRYSHVAGQGKGPLVFREGAPGAAAQRMPFSTFEEMVQSIRSGSDALKRVVFVGRDMPVIEFGRAVHAAYASTQRSLADVLIHVPGPREAFEGVWSQCIGTTQPGADLDGIITVGPNGTMETSRGLAFKQRWHETYPGEPVAWRAARVYDALILLQEGVRIVNHQLQTERHSVDKRAYRLRLAQVVDAIHFDGVSASYSFVHGELGGSNHVSMYIDRVGIVQLPSFEELAIPRPQGVLSADVCR
ncbi:MAG: hypothetical protein RLZZ450_5869 [Pseudomonadota bacterium]|jgi:hypothetical protein